MRIPVLIAALSLTLVGACTSAEGQAGPDIEVIGDFGDKPTVRFPEGRPPSDLRIREQVAGTGSVIKGNDLVVAHYTAHVWDGEDNRLLASSFNQGAPASFPLGPSIAGVGKALKGHRVGSRVVAAIPPEDGYGPNPPGGMTADDELFYVVDVLGAFPPDAAARGRGGPGVLAGVKVAGASGERPALTLPRAKPPTRLQSRILIQGTGAKTRPGQLLVTQYEGRIWGSGASFDSTWDSGQPKSFQIGKGGVIAGWDRALVGVPAGSRVAVIVPPGLGYENGLPPLIKPTDTLVFVVDVLAAY
ncbi:FKBP-type peptidyl-prolyl cis-trans isomerase [Streptosporangium sp. NPDC000396]|uniref:FKBP-type peptidyl-prolyl cis-trans isomerase n=1 Tax=Streptosporangium sp. NPDC000396 TaxID=3366185 RepID=UPI003691CEE1